MSPVEQLNALSDDDAVAALGAVCGSKRWVEMMLRARPFASVEDLEDAGQAAWAALDRADWLEAFAAHPRIGERFEHDPDRLRQGFGGQEGSSHKDDRGWSRDEQKGMDAASAGARGRFVELNRRYEDRFGYIFIVCATGRTADEMLFELETRMTHTPEQELPIAAAEQAKIIRLRIEKLCRP